MGPPMGPLWDPYGTLMGPPWDPHGTPMGPLWDPHGTPMGPLWDPHGTPIPLMTGSLPAVIGFYDYRICYRQSAAERLRAVQAMRIISSFNKAIPEKRSYCLP